jgi:transcription elongation GreA/GreB family factor
MDKRIVIEKIISKLGEDLEIIYKAALASKAEATDPSSKAENKYDTRGLEAGYLATGQMRHAAEIEQSITEIQKLPFVAFEAKSPIRVGALVKLKTQDQQNFYFIAPKGGGVEIEINGQAVIVLTPQSPLGQLLHGKKVGDQFKFGEQALSQSYSVQSVS